MKTNHVSRIVQSALVALIALTLGSSLATAQATRTWVSGVGDDANPCSRTAPCKTFAGAISKTAVGGEIDALDSGGFGAVTITKSITIDGGGNIAGVLVSGTNAIIVNAAGGVVNLRNLDINGVNDGGLNGINILSTGEVNIENCVIYEFSQTGINIAPTAGGGAGNQTRVAIKNTIVRGCNTGGVVANPGAGGANVTISKCHLVNNFYGFRGFNFNTVLIEDSVLSQNANNGVEAAASAGATTVNVNGCSIGDNGIYGVVSQGAKATVRISNNTIVNNLVGISALTSNTLFSFGNNRIRDNGLDIDPGNPIQTIGQQ